MELVKRNLDGNIMIKQVKKILTATIECPTCGRQTSDRPERCSHCGNKL